jgi:hypothetical protein
MTTEQTMLKRFGSAALAAAILATSLAFGYGCARKEGLAVPTVLSAPYDTTRGDPLWAVVPLRNESGTTLVDRFEVSDKVVAAAAQVRGVRVLPLNRTIATMRGLGLSELGSPADARRLAVELGVDGLILGSIIAWDPYNPPKAGIALALYEAPGALQNAQAGLDVRALRYQPTDYQYFPRTAFSDAPASVVSEYLDGKNHQVQTDLQRYARGRHDPGAALGWRRYLTSMDLFSEFATWHAVERLLEHESIRLARSHPGESAADASP